MEIQRKNKLEYELYRQWLLEGCRCIDGDILVQDTDQKVKDWKWMKKKFLFLEKTQKFTKTPSSIPCGGLYYTVDPLNISYIVFYPFLFSTSSVALFYSPTVLRVSKVYPNISKRLCNFDHPTTNAGGLSAWSPRLLDRMSLAAAQALTVDQSAAGKPLGAPSLCVCVAPTLSLCH